MLKDDNRAHKLSKAILNHYSHTAFVHKKVLDCGSGNGDIAAALCRLGASVICADARQSNLNLINRLHPYIKTVRVDFDSDNWPFKDRQFDFVLSLGLLSHLKNFDRYLEKLLALGENIVLETEVLDSDDATIRVPIFEESSVDHLSFHGEGSIVSAENIQNRISSLCATYKRMDDGKLNHGNTRYDWKGQNAGRVFGNNRLYFIRTDNFWLNRQARLPIPEIQNVNPIIGNQNSPIGSLPKYTPPPPNYTQDPNMPIISRIQQKQPIANVAKTRLFYNYYSDKDSRRKQEIDLCFNRNKSSPHFEFVNVESENNPTFNQFFEKINQVAGPNDVSIICNADIFFDETIEMAKNIPPKTVYALTRWNYYSDKVIQFFKYNYSQDVWIIRGKIENVNGDFQIGKLACDGRIAFEFDKAGYKVLNPSKSIKAYHLHNSGVRNYTLSEEIQGPRLFIDPIELPSAPTIFALTSMNPHREHFTVQKQSIDSWVAAGCKVVSFQSNADMRLIDAKEWPNVEFVEVEPSKFQQFSSYIPIDRMTNWVAKRNGFAFIVNSDCRLCVSTVVMNNLANISRSGLVYMARHDVDGSGFGSKVMYGIDGFLFPTEHAHIIPNSEIFCMGKPGWDTVLPFSILNSGKLLSTTSFPTLVHTIHRIRWSKSDQILAEAEFSDIFGWRKPNNNNKFLNNCNTGAEVHLNIVKHTENINYDPTWPPIPVVHPQSSRARRW